MHRMGIAELIEAAQRLAAQGMAREAATLYAQWAAGNPGHPLLHAVHFNRGVLLSGAGDPAGAAEAFGSAIRCNPGFLPPYINLGTLHEKAGSGDSALALWGHVATSLAGVTPEAVGYKVAALKQTAQLLESRKQLAEAEAVLRQIAELAPQRDVIQHWMSLRQRQCAWPLLEPLAGLDAAALIRRMAPLTLANYADDPMLLLASAWSYCREDVGWPVPPPAAPEAQRRPGRLRIGYLSSDLRDHAIGYLMASMFTLHDRSSFEIFVYYNGIPQEDATKRRIRDSVEHWTSIAELDDEAALARIRADAIDILVDVNGHTRGARTALLMRRPAPVIVNWLGYPGTMGSPCHHYIIADEVIIPPGSEMYYSEKVLRLPCYQPNDRARVAAPAPSRAACSLPENATVFCSFNGAQKITPAVFARWMTILGAVPASVLWLLRSNDAVEQRLRARATEAGIAPERLVFAPLLGNPEHLARYACADLFLDSFPYGAHTTASDALWMATPVLTLAGRSFASRVCASLVRAAGLPEMVCTDAEQYVSCAIALGRDRATLLAYRGQLEAARPTAPLFDTQALVCALEGLYWQMARDLASDALPRPDLANLDVYLELGAPLCAEGMEAGCGWHDALARRDAMARLPHDARYWPAPRRCAGRAAA